MTEHWLVNAKKAAEPKPEREKRERKKWEGPKVDTDDLESVRERLARVDAVNDDVAEFLAAAPPKKKRTVKR